MKILRYLLKISVVIIVIWLIGYIVYTFNVL